MLTPHARRARVPAAPGAPRSGGAALQPRSSLRFRTGEQSAQRLARIRPVRLAPHHDLAVESHACATGGNSAKHLFGVCPGRGVLDPRVGILDLLVLAQRHHREPEVGALPGESHREGGAGRLRADIDAVQPVAGVAADCGAERVEYDGAHRQLLQPVMVQRGAGADIDRHGAVHEARVGAGADVPLDEQQLRLALELQFHARVGCAAVCIRARHEHQLEAHRLSGVRGDADGRAIGGERLVQQCKALIRVGARSVRGRGRCAGGIAGRAERRDRGGGGIQRRGECRRKRTIHKHIARKAGDRGWQFRCRDRLCRRCGNESQALERAQVRVLPVLIARCRQAARRECGERRAPACRRGPGRRQCARGVRVFLDDAGGKRRAHGNLRPPRL